MSERLLTVLQSWARGPEPPSGPRALGLDGRKIEAAADVVAFVSERPIGARVEILLYHHGASATKAATLGELPSSDVPREHLGLELQSLTREIAVSLGLPSTTRGALIASVEADSPAQAAGLRPGEVVAEVDRHAVSSAETAVAALQSVTEKPCLLRVLTADGARFVVLRGR